MKREFMRLEHQIIFQALAGCNNVKDVLKLKTTSLEEDLKSLVLEMSSYSRFKILEEVDRLLKLVSSKFGDDEFSFIYLQSLLFLHNLRALIIKEENEDVSSRGDIGDAIQLALRSALREKEFYVDKYKASDILGDGCKPIKAKVLKIESFIRSYCKIHKEEYLFLVARKNDLSESPSRECLIVYPKSVFSKPLDPILAYIESFTYENIPPLCKDSWSFFLYTQEQYSEVWKVWNNKEDRIAIYEGTELLTSMNEVSLLTVRKMRQKMYKFFKAGDDENVVLCVRRKETTKNLFVRILTTDLLESDLLRIIRGVCEHDIVRGTQDTWEVVMYSPEQYKRMQKLTGELDFESTYLIENDLENSEDGEVEFPLTYFMENDLEGTVKADKVSTLLRRLNFPLYIGLKRNDAVIPSDYAFVGSITNEKGRCYADNLINSFLYDMCLLIHGCNCTCRKECIYNAYSMFSIVLYTQKQWKKIKDRGSITKFEYDKEEPKTPDVSKEDPDPLLESILKYEKEINKVVPAEYVLKCSLYDTLGRHEDLSTIIRSAFYLKDCKQLVLSYKYGVCGNNLFLLRDNTSSDICKGVTPFLFSVVNSHRYLDYSAIEIFLYTHEQWEKVKS